RERNARQVYTPLAAKAVAWRGNVSSDVAKGRRNCGSDAGPGSVRRRQKRLEPVQQRFRGRFSAALLEGGVAAAADHPRTVGEDERIPLDRRSAQAGLSARSTASRTIEGARLPSSRGTAAAGEHRAVDKQKGGKGEDPRASGDMHQRQREIGKERHRDARSQRNDEAPIGEHRPL